MEEIWIVCLGVIAFVDSAPTVAQPGFINVVCSATDRKVAESKVRDCLLSYGWRIMQVENASRVDDDAAYDDELWELIEEVRQNPESIPLATLHSFRVN